MNDLQQLIDRQLGFPCRYGYDSVLRRLVVRESDWYRGFGTVGAEESPIFACRFSEAPGHRLLLALANEDGRVALQNLCKERTRSVVESYQCHNNAVFDLAWMPGELKFVTVSGDHTACLWEVTPTGPQRLGVFAGHTRSVKCSVFPHESGSLFATGGRDGAVLVWDARAPPRPQLALLGCHAAAAPRTPASHGKRARLDAPRPVSITGLAFQDEHRLASCGECDGNILVWDLRRSYSAAARAPLPARALPYAGGSPRPGYCALAAHAPHARLYAAATDGAVYCYSLSAAAPRPLAAFRGHCPASFYIKLAVSPDGRYLASGSSDKCLYVWTAAGAGAGGGQAAARLAAHRAEVTGAAWAAAPAPLLVTAGDDASHAVWTLAIEGDGDEVIVGRAEMAAAAPPPARAASPPRRRPPAAPARRAKRCLLDLLGPPAKRARPPSPAAPAAPPAAKRACADDADASPPKRKPLAPRSPNAPPPSPGAAVRDFVAALPDYARDGAAPHLRLMSPLKRKADNPDWLTRLVQEKRARVPPAAPAPAPASPKENAPPRRPATPRARAGGSLLKYFTVTSRHQPG